MIEGAEKGMWIRLKKRVGSKKDPTQGSREDTKRGKTLCRRRHQRRINTGKVLSLLRRLYPWNISSKAFLVFKALEPQRRVAKKFFKKSVDLAIVTSTFFYRLILALSKISPFVLIVKIEFRFIENNW